MAFASSSTIAVIAFGCLLAVVSVVYDQLYLLLPYSSSSSGPGRRRELRSNSSSSPNNNSAVSSSSSRNRRLARKNYDEADLEFKDDESSVYPWARTNLRRLSAGRSSDQPENFLFWHIPKSGGSAIKAYYQCVGKIITTESHSRDILAAREAGLVESGRVDVIFSSNPNFAIQQLFDSQHRGRAMAVFRHPVERLVSKFYYLQMATWEKSYKPEWEHTTLLSWATSENSDNEHMVKRLAGKINTDVATPEDLRIAKGTVRRKFVVGLTSKLEESVMRFNDVMGVDHAVGAQRRGSRGRGCMEAFFGEKATKKNSNSHPTVEVGSEEWNVLAERNRLDVELYEYVVRLFDEQKEIIDTYDAAEAFFGEEKEAMREEDSNSHPEVEGGSEEEWNNLLPAERNNELDMELYEDVVRLFDEQKEIIDTYDAMAMTTTEAQAELAAAEAAGLSPHEEASAMTTTAEETLDVAVVAEA